MAKRYGPQQLRQTLGRVSLLIAITTFLAIPAIYAYTAIRYEGIRLTAEADRDAKALSRMIFQFANTWSFQESRIEELVSGDLPGELATFEQIFDTGGEPVVATGTQIGSPKLTHEVVLYNGVEPVGRLKVTGRIRHIFIQTGFAALLGLLLGGGMYVILRVLPMRALERAAGEIEKTAGQLTQEVQEREAVEDRLRQSQKLEALGQLTGGIAHDFNNLLAIIQGNADLCAMKGDVDKKYFDPIMRATKRGSDLTQRLLAFARKQPLLPSSVDITGLVDGMLDMLTRSLGETIDIETFIESGLWRVIADPAQVENAVLNLALNARAAMPQGGKLTISCSNIQIDEPLLDGDTEISPGDCVSLVVTDNGQGMTADVKEHAFEPFFTTKDVGEGTGLGLSMIYGFAKQSGGHVAIYSEVGTGTSVKLYLPRDKSDKPGETVHLSTETPPGKGETVLVIEDETDVRMVAVEMLETLDYKVIDVPSAPGAREVIGRGEKVDLVLSDVVLPGGTSGPEFAEEVARTHPGLKFIFMSGYPAEAALRNDMIGVSGALLSKPFRRPQLAQAVRKTLDGET